MILLCEALLKLGWEFDKTTKGVHFMMLTGENEGVGFDAVPSPIHESRLKVYKYSFFINLRGVEIEDEPIQYMTVAQLVALTEATLEQGYEEGEFGF